MVKWGIVGLGNMAHKFAQSINEVDNAQLSGIASLNKNRLSVFKNNFSISEKDSFSNYIELIESNKIDAIYISTLNNSHIDLIIKCAENKKNILCEKPITLNYEDAKKAQKIIKENNVIFFEGYAYRSHPQIKKIIDLVNNEDFGDVVSIKAEFGFYVKKIKPESRLFNKELGGGSILDVGCYPLSFISLFSDEANEIKFEKVSGSFVSKDVDDFAEAKFIMNNKIECYVKSSFKENLKNKIEIKGTKKNLIINNPWLPDKKTTLEIGNNESYHKEFINSEFSLYANQIQKISESFEKKIINDKYLVNIDESVKIMKNLTNWLELIRKQYQSS